MFVNVKEINDNVMDSVLVMDTNISMKCSKKDGKIAYP
jgi:hypothetical protein